MKIVIVTPYAPPHSGGIEFIAWEQARSFVEMGHFVRWFSSAIPLDAAHDPLSEAVEFTRYPAWNILEHFGIPYPLFAPGKSRPLAGMIADSDIVHVHGMLYSSTSTAIRLSRKFRKPVVMTCHVIDRTRRSSGHPKSMIEKVLDTQLHFAEKIAHQRIGNRNLRSCNGVVVYNALVKEYVSAVVRSHTPIRSIPNGVDLEAFHPVSFDVRLSLRIRMGLPLDKPIICFIGRLVPRKGVDLVVRAAAKNAHVLIVGRGRLARSLVTPDVTVWPSQPRARIPEILQACDLLVLPSVGEGFPVVAQEAMACGKPIILAADPAYKDYVTEDFCCLVEPTVEGVRRSLLVLISDARQMEKMGEAARAYAVRHFSWSQNIQCHLNLYTELIARSRLLL